MEIANAIGILRNLGHTEAALAVFDLKIENERLRAQKAELEKEVGYYVAFFAAIPKTFPDE